MFCKQDPKQAHGISFTISLFFLFHLKRSNVRTTEKNLSLSFLLVFLWHESWWVALLLLQKIFGLWVNVLARISVVYPWFIVDEEEWRFFSNLACSYLKKVVCIVLFLMGLTSVWKQGYSAREQQKQNKILFRLNFFLEPPILFSISTWFLLHTLYLIRQKIDCFIWNLTEVIVLTHILFQTFVLSFTSEWIPNCFFMFVICVYIWLPCEK